MEKRDQRHREKEAALESSCRQRQEEIASLNKKVLHLLVVTVVDYIIIYTRFPLKHCALLIFQTADMTIMYMYIVMHVQV